MNAKTSLNKVAVVGYNRIPFARANTAYTKLSNTDMLLGSLNGLIGRYHLKGQLIGEVVGGAVIKHTRESALIRDTVLKTSLNPLTPAVDLQQACDTSIQSAIHLANKIALGQIESGIACGVDSTSNVPILASEKLRQVLLAASRATSLRARLGAFFSLRPRDFKPVVPGIKDNYTNLSMGEHTELTAKAYGISRAEQDEFAVNSHRNLAAAYDDGFFTDMISPFGGLDTDNNLRRDTNMTKLGSLKPAFDKLNGTLTAGNSTPLTDGSSTVLLSSPLWAKEHGLEVKAYITQMETGAIDYINHPENLLLAPITTVDRMLARAGLTLQDFDFYEIHEAFAAQVLTTLKIWESEELSSLFGIKALGKIDRNKLNVRGSSLATAHPFAATGARVIATLSKLLDQKGSGRGLISVCAAGGQCVTMILEK